MVFWERQDGMLCAQHAVNALLQGPYYTAVDLAEIARGLDEAERQRMAEAGTDSPEYLRWMAQDSINMDDTGFFSVQVISNALEVFGLKLLRLNAEECKASKENPLQEQGFICNREQHWFTIRAVGAQWFNLDSSQPQAQPISDLYMSLTLAQLEAEGYSIFVVKGELPATSSLSPSALSRAPQDDGLARALAASMLDAQQSSQPAQSLAPPTAASSAPAPTREELRARRAAFLNKK